MANEAHKDAVRTYFKAMGAGEVDLFRSVITDDYVAIVCGKSKISGTLTYDQVLAFVGGVPQMTKNGFNFEIASLTAEDDRVVSESTGKSTLSNGAEYNNQYTHLFRFRDGKIREVKEYMDTTLAEKVLLPVIVLE
ncbi:Nuclear transport factor 2 family protein [Frankia sp. Hr75.2]|nr:Nuclear transport factor 2 family protein [Frankia sp. Hr75.2]